MTAPFVVPLQDLRLVQPETLKMQASREWLGYWADLCTRAPDGAPRRSDLDLICDRPHLAKLAVWIEALDGDYRFILAGEAVNWLFGQSIKDKRLSQIRFTASTEETWRQYDTAVRTGAPCCSVGRYAFSDRSSYRVGGTVTERELVMLPFRNAHGTVDRLLAGMAFDTPGHGHPRR